MGKYESPVWLGEELGRDQAQEPAAQGGETDEVTHPCEQGETCEDDSYERPAAPLNNKELGIRGEEAAARYLIRRGYEILDRNWCCFAGEADIVARDEEGALVFVEVKTRTDTSKGFPEEAVNARKRARYEKIALAYLADYTVVDIPVRFDVISIMVIAPDRALIKHHIGAFCKMG